VGYKIGPFKILTKGTSGNLNPASEYSQWSVIQRVSYRLSTYEYPLPTAVYAQHVAIMENKDPQQPLYPQALVLTEVEVYGFGKQKFGLWISADILEKKNWRKINN